MRMGGQSWGNHSNRVRQSQITNSSEQQGLVHVFRVPLPRASAPRASAPRASAPRASACLSRSSAHPSGCYDFCDF